MTPKHLLRVLRKYKPIRDTAVSAMWLKQHRPSASWLLCLMSGPWVYQRRFTVQANALKVLGTKDLSELTSRDVRRIAVLDWQASFLTASIRYVKKNNLVFDTLFSVSKKEQAQLVLELMQIAKPELDCIDAAPKVVLMFVRDFINYDAFAIDRHVRRWLVENKLPTKSKDVMSLFKKARVQARGYARAVFGAHAKNPVHAPTKQQIRKTRTRDTCRSKQRH